MRQFANKQYWVRQTGLDVWEVFEVAQDKFDERRSIRTYGTEHEADSAARELVIRDRLERGESDDFSTGGLSKRCIPLRTNLE